MLSFIVQDIGNYEACWNKYSGNKGVEMDEWENMLKKVVKITCKKWVCQLL